MPRPPSTSIPSTWRAHVDAWARSGLSAKAFAAQHGLKSDTLYRWRRRLRAAPTPPPPAPRLVEVQLEAPAVCELAFADGRVLRFPLSAEPARVGALVRALEAR